MGYEVFLNPLDSNFIKSKKKLTLARTGYVLFEFPFNVDPYICLEPLRKIQLENIVPIIAHLERSRNFLNNLSNVVGFIKAGCLIQVDAGSIAGAYGKRVKNFAKELVKFNFVDMVASNAHYSNDYCDWYMEAYKNVIKWSGQQYAHKLFYQNAKKILEGSKEGFYKII